MRMLHTADWHLCDRLNRLDRTEDLRARVERVAEYCEEHRVEVLLIAGDLFYERATAIQMAQALDHIHKTFQSFFARGGTILAITGNHDDDAQIDLVRSGMKLAATVPSGGVFQRGRLYIQNGLSFGTFESVSGERVQFVLVPYPNAVRYELPHDYRTREEEHRLLQHHLTEWIGQVFLRPDFDPRLPTVLAAHLHIRGANLNRSLFRLSEADDIQFDPAVLKSAWAYVALGHIHLAQAIDGVETLRYSGPLDRLDLGERDDDRGVVLVEVGPTGVIGSPTWLPLEPTPMHDLTLSDPDAELASLAEKYPDRERAIVRIQVSQPATSELSRDEIARRLRSLFPRLHQITWATEAVEATDRPAATPPAPASFSDTIRQHLTDALAGDPDRDAVLTLAETFLAAETPGDAT